MKQPLLLVVLSFCFFSKYTYAQEGVTSPEKYTAHNKHKIYVYWGGNRSNYSTSDIHFSGNGYNFTVQDAVAHDKPKGWHIDYIDPVRMTIPQTNVRVGYFISDHYNVSLGLDHMKYVMTQYQVANVSGDINLDPSEDGSVFNGHYDNEPVVMSKEFLQFEHTDGLNYINAEIARVDDVSRFLWENTDIVQVNATEGIGGGVLLPKTNATLLGKQRHDAFHLSGYGISAKAGINVVFFKHFFIQGELKGGYIDMNDIRTTYSSSDTASQHFTFFEKMIAIGWIFKV